MTIPDKLKDIIQDDAHISLGNSPNNKTASLIIKETDTSASLKQVTLHHVSAHATFVFNLDCKKIRCGRNHKLSPYFEDGKDLDKGCDAIIVTEIESQWYIFIVELKSNSEQRNSEIFKQFKSSLCFVKYIQAILRIVYEQHDLNNIKPRFVLFSNNASNLRGTKGNVNNTKSTQSIYKKIDGTSIKHLKGKQCSIQKLTQ